MSDRIRVLVIEPGDQLLATAKTVEGDHLTALQQIVGGYVEIIGLGRAAQILANEDGKQLGLPVNMPATRAARWAANFPAIGADDALVGTIAITGPTDEHGELTSVRDATLVRLMGVGFDVDGI